MEKNKKVIVLGATGNLGAYSAVFLKEKGYDVIATGFRKSDNGFFGEKGIEYYSLDITREKDFDKLPSENVYAVVNFAGELPSRYTYDETKLIESIIIGTLNALKYLKKVKGDRIVFPQTPFDYYRYHNTTTPIPEDETNEYPLTGDHSVYTIAKNAAMNLMNHYFAEYGIKKFALRFFTIYQYHPNSYHYSNYKVQQMPYRMLMDRAMKGLDIEVWGDTSKYKEFTYIKDFTQAVFLCLESEGKGGTYNVGCPKPISLEEQIDGIIDVFSSKENKSKKIYRPEKPDPLLVSMDMTKAKGELGYCPKYTYIEALMDFKNEMETEPFAKLWGTKYDFEK